MGGRIPLHLAEPGTVDLAVEGSRLPSSGSLSVECIRPPVGDKSIFPKNGRMAERGPGHR